MAKRSRAVVSLIDEPAIRHRPPAVTVVALLYIIQGGLALTLIAAAMVAVLVEEGGSAAITVTRDDVLAMAGGGIACVSLLTAAFGLFMLRRWGWIVAMTTECFVLTFDLAVYLAGRPLYVGMIVGAITVLLLNQRHVRLAFEPKGSAVLDAGSVSSGTRRADDLALLRRFEPILHLSAGEAFTPQSVEPYLERCSLWVHHAEGRDELLVERGRLTPELLAAQRHLPADSVLYLDFVDPLDLPELTSLLLQEGVDRLWARQPAFRPHTGRLARLGYGSRLLAALFSLSLLLRGRVPGDTAAAASLAARQILQRHPDPVYYGRVVRDPRGWIVLQYWFFYAFNNWRSGFFGANDHEADWEMICVYLYEREDGEVAPEWVAYSCHDFSGGDLRRRWDDRGELTLVDEHPVVHVGAGSHAGYFHPGDYIAEIEIGLFAPVARTIDLLRRFWVGTLRQAGVVAHTDRIQLFRVPFVEYARADGLRIGPGQDHAWSPILLDPVPAWAESFRGLWGFYARDPLGGEDSPAGPMYERDGRPRPSWQDPLRWAGLDGAPTPRAERALLARRRVELLGREREIVAELTNRLDRLEPVNVDLAALRDEPHLRHLTRELTVRRRDLRHEIEALRQEQAETSTLVTAVEERQARLAAGKADPPTAHANRLAQPVPEPSYRLRRVTEVWSALSIAALIAAVLGLLLVDGSRTELAPHLLVLVMTFVIVDAFLRQQAVSVVSTLAVILATVCVLIVVVDFLWHIMVGTVVVAVLYLAWSNIREVFR